MSDKDLLRATVRARRSAMSDEQRTAARLAICHAVLRQCEVLGLAAGATVAAYQPLRTEPGSVELLQALVTAGYRVIVPFTLPDRDLDWIRWTVPVPESEPAREPGPDRPDSGQPGSGQPESDRPGPGQSGSGRGHLGLAEISRAELVLVPAFAVDGTGNRLGRGGGSYDRALARVRPGAVVAALLFASELVDRVPTEAWDVPISAAVTPNGWLDLTPTGRGNS